MVFCLIDSVFLLICAPLEAFQRVLRWSASDLIAPNHIRALTINVFHSSQHIFLVHKRPSVHRGAAAGRMFDSYRLKNIQPLRYAPFASLCALSIRTLNLPPPCER